MILRLCHWVNPLFQIGEQEATHSCLRWRRNDFNKVYTIEEGKEGERKKGGKKGGRMGREREGGV